MSFAFDDYVAALRAFAAAPESENNRRAVGVRRFAAIEADPEKSRWPALLRAALALGDAVMDAPFRSVRSLALAPVCAATAAALDGDVGNIRMPSTPAAPPRQYKDE